MESWGGRGGQMSEEQKKQIAQRYEKHVGKNICS